MLWPPKPENTVEQVVEACMDWLISKGENDALRGRLPDLIAHESAYRNAGEEGTLLALLLTQVPTQRKDKDADLLKQTYETGLVQRKSGRRVYDARMTSAVHGRCSLCGLQQVAQLDHHAPKADFPLLALTPLNLVPVCGPCNQSKSNKLATVIAEEALHPYFDDLGSERWLYAEVCGQAGVANFEAHPPADWSETKSRRLLHHFKSHKLGYRYRLEAGALMARRRKKDASSLADLGPEGLQALIQCDAESCAAYDPNGCETALLHGLAESAWYLNGGMESVDNDGPQLRN